MSTNDGDNWLKVNTGLTNSFVACLAVTSATNVMGGATLFAGTENGVFVSGNSGASWTQINSGLTKTDILSSTICGANIFIGTRSGGVWRRSLDDISTSIPREPDGPPVQFYLAQNYPNPFNPVTTISFVIPSRSSVMLKVFDILGKEVETIVNGELSAGNHSYRWDASDFSSGVYFYRVQAGAFAQTRKLLLLK